MVVSFSSVNFLFFLEWRRLVRSGSLVCSAVSLLDLARFVAFLDAILAKGQQGGGNFFSFFLSFISLRFTCYLTRVRLKLFIYSSRHSRNTRTGTCLPEILGRMRQLALSLRRRSLRRRNSVQQMQVLQSVRRKRMRRRFSVRHRLEQQQNVRIGQKFRRGLPTKFVSILLFFGRSKLSIVVAQKEGECPELTRNENARCDNECRNDADCTLDLKCCSNGCGTACVVPLIHPPPGQLVTTSYQPAHTEAPLEVPQHGKRCRNKHAEF